eukprot:s1096_g6.t1
MGHRPTSTDSLDQMQACSDAESARSKCEQVERISIATGAAECQHRRVFYTCMLTEGPLAWHLQALRLFGVLLASSLLIICSTELCVHSSFHLFR